MTNQMLESILHVLINGPPATECSHIIDQAVKDWLAASKRRKLPTSNHREDHKNDVINNNNLNEPIAQKSSEIETDGADDEENLETETDPDVCDEENLQLVSKAFGCEDETEYSDCEPDDSESDSDDCFDLLLS